LVGYVATAAAILLVPVLFVPEAKRSEFFWQRILWTEFLVLLVWAYLAGFLNVFIPNGRKDSGLAGVLPAAGLGVFAYALLSFALLMVYRDLSAATHIGFQLILFVALVLLFVSLNLARVSAVSGTQPVPAGIKPPQELSALLRVGEEKVWASVSRQGLTGEPRRLHDALKRLREKLQYSIQHVGSVGESKEYSELAAAVVSLNSELQALPPEFSDQETARRLANKAEDLCRKTELIGQMLVRRPS
jgi:hypothetical protein